MKRIIEKVLATILATFIMLSAMSASVFAVGGSQLSSKTADGSKDSGKPVVTIESVSADSGVEVEMAVSLSDAPGLNLIIIENIAYDANLLKLIGATWEEKGENDFDYNESELPEDKDLMMREFGDKDVDVNGKIATLKFEVIGKTGDSAEVGFNVAMISVDSTSALEYELKKGIVTITCSHFASEDWQSDDETHWHICTVCNTKIDEAVHTFDWSTVKEATEEEEGLEKGVCSVCKHETERAIPKKEHVHKYGEEWLKDSENHWHECKCGEKSDIAAHTYDWTTVKEATEEEEGLEKGVCSVCKYETERAIPKKDHEHKYGEEWLMDSENHWHECKCGEKSDIAAHTYEWTTVKEATEEEEGLEKGVCSACKYETERAIPKKDHEHKYGEEWLKDSENHWHECKCGEKSDVAAHTYEWATVKEATEEEEGLEKGVCSVCEYETERAIPKKNHIHTMVFNPEIPATCSAVGTRAHWRCTACNKLFADENGNVEITDLTLPINPNNHLFNGNVCVNCGYNRVGSANNAIIYLNEMLHGIFRNGQMIPYPHIADALGLRTDGTSTWYVCDVCGHAFGMTASAVNDEPGDTAQVIDVDTPTEAGDNTEEVEGDNVSVTDNAPEKSENPKTGVALSVVPLVLALLASIVKKH